MLDFPSAVEKFVPASTVYERVLGVCISFFYSCSCFDKQHEQLTYRDMDTIATGERLTAAVWEG